MDPVLKWTVALTCIFSAAYLGFWRAGLKEDGRNWDLDSSDLVFGAVISIFSGVVYWGFWIAESTMFEGIGFLIILLMSLRFVPIGLLGYGAGLFFNMLEQKNHTN